MTQYRQIAHRLRLQMGPGRPDIVSERPRVTRTGKYLDLGADGKSTTTIDVPDDAQPSAERLLNMGAIEPLPEPKVSVRKEAPADAQGEAPGGQAAS